MKRRLLIKRIEDAGFVLKRHGSDHDIYTKDNIVIQIPRHAEINEYTARGILRKAGAE